jgi:hypothetical protein
MQREIKFRAWDKKRAQMLAVPLIPAEIYEVFKLPEQFDLMQFTGLKDKNGKEIYEGDALSTESGQCLVQWYKQAAAFRFIFEGPNSESPLNYDDVEVIGNIYQNPELLKK